MPEPIVAAFGSLRLYKREDGSSYLAALSYPLNPYKGFPRLVKKDVIESFFSVTDGLHRLSQLSKH